MRQRTVDLPPAAEEFLAGNHLCTFVTIRPDGSPHAVPVRFTWDAGSGLVRIMTVATRRKVRNLLARPGERVSLCQVEGSRWLTLEGTALATDDAARVAEGARRYTRRYWSPPPNPHGLVVIEVAIDRVMGHF